MSYITLQQIPDFVGSSVTIKGWVLHHRPSGKLVFFELRDGSGYVQCVVSKMDVDNEIFELAKNLHIETSCAVTGTVRSDDRSKYGFEIDVQQLDILNDTVAEYPISEKEHGVAFLLEKRHLWLRSPRQVAIMKIRATIIKETRDYLDTLGFISFDTPIFTPTACEGTTTLFETQYFDDTAYLTQSGQLYAEAGAMALGKVYTFGPAFRAEKSKTRRHLTEFWMVEPEASFHDLDDILIVAENMIAAIVARVLERHEADLACIERDTHALEAVTAPFPRITYDDAIKLCVEAGNEISWGDDFGADDETIISNAFEKPVIIERYPASCKPFYMKNDPMRPEVVLNCDIIAPEGYGEIVGGSQREDDYETLITKLEEHGIDPEPLDWYLDLRRYGSVPHSGFGLGIERTVTWICGLHHVRESIPFPRMLEKCRP